MYQIISDSTKGTIQISDSWSITATGSFAAPSLTSINQEIIYSFTELNPVEKFKSFKYDYIGQTDNRYLTTQYRVSRDGNSWTPWIDLKSNIENFPPFNSKNLMYIDIKFIRKGSSTNGTIKLLDYTLTGVITRNEVDGEKTIVLTPINNEVIIKPPYIYKVFSITDIEVLNSGSSSDFNIKYRFSQDYGRTVSEWEPFTKENITTLRISPIRFFQIEYLIEYVADSKSKIYDINLIGDFQNVTLDYFKTNLYGIRENCNCKKLNIVNDSSSDLTVPVGGQSTALTPSSQASSLPILSSDDKNALFKPYQLTEATSLLNKLSNDSTEIFGHEVVYFITDPDKKGIDYTFHEYQLMNYVCEGLIKVAVENNQFPDNQIVMNQFDLALFDTFEIHITKEIFKRNFGPEKRPSKEDFLWFCNLNRMYTVEHAQPFRSFNNNAIYYKVMLKKYVQKANVIGANQTISDKVKDLTKNSTIDELFGIENTQDKKSVANKEQNKPLTKDLLRISIQSKINKELIENSELIISKTNYDLSSVMFTPTESTEAVTYRNMDNYYRVSDNIGFMCWFSINNYTVNDNYHFFNYYDNVNSLGIDISLRADNFVAKLNNVNYEMPLGVTGGSVGLSEETWYCYVLNVDQRQRKINQFIYKRDVDVESDASKLSSTKLLLVYSKEHEHTPLEFKLEDISASILSCDMKITNIRLFSEIIPVEQHNKMLNQSIIGDDSKYLIFADNANQRLVLPNYPIGQISNSSV